MHSHPVSDAADDSSPHCPFCRGSLPFAAAPDLRGVYSIHLARMVPEFVHDIRTPLRVIQSAVEVLRDGAIDDPAIRDQFLESIMRGADNLDRLVGTFTFGRWADDLETLRSHLEGVHRRLDDLYRVRWPVDLTALASADVRVANGYSQFLGLLAYCVLRSVRRASSSDAHIAYTLTADRLVGTAAVGGTTEVDADGWNMLRLAAAAAGATVTAVAGDGFTLRWEYPLD